MDDANCEETEYLEEILDNKNYNAKIRDIAIFFTPSNWNEECNHLEPLIGEFLPKYLYESEEMTFMSSDKNLTIKKVFNDLINAGFKYDPEYCVLSIMFDK